MNELRLFDPLAVDPFEDTFRSLMRPWRMEAMETPRIKLDLHELDTSYTVKAEIPGVRKEDIYVRVDGNTVTTSAEEGTRISLPLWGPPWTARFAAAGAAASLQRAQLRHAQTGVEWKATTEIMALFNLHTERAAALAFDRAVQQGPNGAKGIARRLHAALIAEGLVVVEAADLLQTYAEWCAAGFRRSTPPNPPSAAWNPINGAWHKHAGGVDLYTLIQRRTQSILSDPSLSDVPEEVTA